MTTVIDQIEQVCRLYSRMDKVQDMSVAFSGFLREAHSLDFWRRDIQKSYVINPTIVNGVVQIDLNTELSPFRRLYRVNTYTAFTPVGSIVYPDGLILTPKPYHEGDMNGLTDYYGHPDRYTWFITGTSLQLRDIDSNAKCIEIFAFGYPTYGNNPLDGVLETNSWIFRDWPQLLEAYCRKWLTSYLKDTELQRAATTNFYEKRSEFIAAHAQEIVSWQ